jgi:hypothetical protein
MQVPCLFHSCSQKLSGVPEFGSQYEFMKERRSGFSEAEIMSVMLLYVGALVQNCG